MNNIINKITSISAIIAVLLVIPLVSFAEAPSGSPIPAPVVIDNGNTGTVAISAPAIVDNGNTASVALSIIDNGNTGTVAVNSPIIINNGNTGTVAAGAPNIIDNGNTGTVAVNPPIIINNGNAGTVGSNPSVNVVEPNPGSRSGGSSGSSYRPTISGTCSYLNSYLNINSGSSDEMEIMKLQAFLINNENHKIDINGKFDSKTFEAVKSFQAKYANDVLTPWGSINPTGNVFYTTKKKVNEIYCKSTFALTAEQIAEIESYKNNKNVNVSIDTDNKDNTDTKVNVDNTNANDIKTDNESDDSQIGAVAKTTFTTKVVNFVKWLFGF